MLIDYFYRFVDMYILTLLSNAFIAQRVFCDIHSSLNRPWHLLSPNTQVWDFSLHVDDISEFYITKIFFAVSTEGTLIHTFYSYDFINYASFLTVRDIKRDCSSIESTLLGAKSEKMTPGLHGAIFIDFDIFLALSNFYTCNKHFLEFIV